MAEDKVKPDEVVMEFVESFKDPEMIAEAEAFHKKVTRISVEDLFREFNI